MADERKGGPSARSATGAAARARVAEEPAEARPAEARPDEAPVGGRYMVDGRVVNAAGEPRTDE